MIHSLIGSRSHTGFRFW